MTILIKCMVLFNLLLVASSQNILFSSGRETCDNLDKNVTSSCLPLMECVNENRLNLKICGWNGPGPAVCCELGSGVPISFMLDTTSVTSITPNPILKTGRSVVQRPSVAKCEEYQEILRPENYENYDPATNPTNDVDPLYSATVTVRKEYPHMVLIGWTDIDNQTKWYCGGSIISESYILTAAHCHLANSVPPNVVRVGEHDLRVNGTKAHGRDARIKRFIVHPDYRKPSVYNDIALIEIFGYIKYSVSVRPACLNQNPNNEVKRVTATGWGETQFGGETSPILLKVEVTYVNTTTCERFYRNNRRIRNGIIPSQICYGDSSGLMRNACQGDSGGPIQIFKFSKYGEQVFYIIGIISTGMPCGYEAPGIYTRVASYIDWIESVVWPTQINSELIQ